MTIFRYAWRNLWRNKQRTIITIAAISLNTAILIISYALMDGMIKHTVNNMTNMVVGEAQIHGKGYRDDRSFYKSLPNPEQLIQSAGNQNIGAAPRSYGYGLISVGTKSAGAMFWGINPDIEMNVFDLPKQIQHGQYLSIEAEKGLVLGKKLTRSLNAGVGSEIIVVVQAADGSLGNDLYTVTGILKTAGDSIDRSMAIMHKDDFRDLFVSGGRIHEIALNTKGKLETCELAERMRPDEGEGELRTWRELLPMLSDMVNIFDVVIWIFGAIFFLAAGLGVMNTMLMATYERIREFGIQKALGTSPLRIVGNMAAEAFVLSLFSAVLGTFFGLIGSYYLQEVGIDTSMFAGTFSFSGIAFDPVWRAVISAQGVIFPVLVMCITCTAASLYPAIIAARLDPVKAIYHV